ncbi:MAG TPA: nickel pincer cofactor biosynthesis protein LarB [Spirochaetota bacterium]|jgi:hypothetical protein|nr:MAG: AIR carboxylase [Spirochaetes bacterium ADurb.Bin133]HNZ26485.1 nickel pincer cofactor biosynthesis protein LarB [Spirochaetota bacterium]HOE99860.1 nickel pincer cofactor biosynthesis protein LarB [Spirochaetota bacterium]HOS31780.1 nickel pincer cofactor biosynthesis protein LarB [Spirochaetota bacterium]HOS55186.1 nickel pincer cofactor biosynthesis protein LarB [Spirochaetota bacterium]
MDKKILLDLLKEYKENRISAEEVAEKLKDLPFKDLGFVKLDSHRELRRGHGEAIYSKNKTKEQLVKICKETLELKIKSIIYTKINKKKAAALMDIDPDLIYNEPALTLYKSNKAPASDKKIVIVAAGSSDIPIAEEAYCAALAMGNVVEKYFDVGVAGIHRLFAIYDKLTTANVIIAIAGMEGALPSVISGLVDCPVIAVPTSVGYGANLGGVSALLTMINSCSPGIAVVNIDNGFGAGYIASQINSARL